MIDFVDKKTFEVWGRCGMDEILSGDPERDPKGLFRAAASCRAKVSCKQARRPGETFRVSKGSV